MPQRFLKTTLFIFLCISICSCIHTRFISMTSETDRHSFDLAALNSSGVPLYFSTLPKREYSEIDYVMSRGTLKFTNAKDMLVDLKSKAHGIGADAVINIHFSTSTNRWGSDVILVTGIAIKYK